MSTYMHLFIFIRIHILLFFIHTYIYIHTYISNRCLHFYTLFHAHHLDVHIHKQPPPKKKKKQVWVPNINWGVFLLMLVIQTALTKLVYMTRDPKQDSTCSGFCGSWIKCFISTFSYVWHLRCVAFCMCKFSYMCGILYVCLWSHV